MAEELPKPEELIQIEHRLMDILNRTVQSRRLAKDLMSSPPIMVSADVSCKEASSLLTRYNVNALLVTQNSGKTEILAGLISRQVIEKALYHKLDHVPVREYMTTELGSVGPEADIKEIQENIIENKHLPEVASAATMEKEGVFQTEMNQKLLQKIEELTLYLIEQDKELGKLIEQNEQLRIQNERIFQLEDIILKTNNRSNIK